MFSLNTGGNRVFSVGNLNFRVVRVRKFPLAFEKMPSSCVDSVERITRVCDLVGLNAACTDFF